MNKKLKIHDGDTPGKVFEVKLEYPKPKVVQMENNKLICPFCNKKLEPIGTSGQFQCGTWGCDASFNFYATRDVWEYIDRTRKALDVAVDMLKLVYQGNGDPQDIMRYKDNRWTAVRRLCMQALDEITALEQKDK